MLSHPHLFLSPNAFFQRAFKTHSDPQQGVWEFTICNFETRELKLESTEQECTRNVGCSPPPTFLGLGAYLGLAHTSEHSSEAVVGGEQLHLERQAWLCVLTGVAVTLSKAGARSPHEAAVSPDARRAEGQAWKVCACPLPRDRPPAQPGALQALGQPLSRGPLGISRVSVLRLQRGHRPLGPGTCPRSHSPALPPVG